ncbi:DUF2809 domain-containing protein [Paenibacillus sp. GCM10023248]|uniref:ribosomal maturation YjgA family protein n=1 Tax=Bacillales TaxID=1385 RepID=UPI002377E0A1|nr:MULTISPECIES: DUF2809 domain-containing protein [Bacillales]MDD9268100.1 DUF2809 domain-containing protein [Paenibacillus sp. MAHUQ-63]MDR6879776.1 glycopeptide antibiotics resistance protein [Bacillus sp. 3255]
MIRYGAAVVIAMMLGLASRRFASYLPTFWAEHTGDMLWASMVYFGIRLMMNKRQKLGLAAALTLLFSFGIEFSQLNQSVWMTDLRSTTLGALVLGRGFLWIDLVRYAFGTAMAYGVDKLWLRGK